MAPLPSTATARVAPIIVSLTILNAAIQSSHALDQYNNNDLITIPLRYAPPKSSPPPPSHHRALQEGDGETLYPVEGKTSFPTEGNVNYNTEGNGAYPTEGNLNYNTEGKEAYSPTEGKATYPMEGETSYEDSGSNRYSPGGNEGEFASYNSGNNGKNSGEGEITHNAIRFNPDDHYLKGDNGWGTHYVDVWIGNPAQKRTLAVLTNSDFTALPCLDCTKCGTTITKKYDQSSSSTFDTVPCGQCMSQLNANDPNDPSSPPQQDQVDICDMNGEACLTSDVSLDHSSWTAYEVRDFAFVGGAAALGEDLTDEALDGSDVAVQYGFPLVFGCQTFASGWYANQVQDGILGFSSAPSSFVSQMYMNKMLRQRKFALCFRFKPEIGIITGEEGPSGDDEDIGVVTLGGYDPRLIETPMSYAQRIVSEGDSGYKVYVNGIYLREGGGQSIAPNDISQKIRPVKFSIEEFNLQQVARNNAYVEGGIGAVVDAGTPYILLDKSVESAFQNAWKKATGGKAFSYGKLYLTDEEVERMPTLIFQFQSADNVDRSINPTTVANMAGDLDPSSPYDVLVAVPATHYLQYNKHGNFYRTLISLQNEGTVLGASMMQGHNVVYDLESNRIGFAEASSCRVVPSAMNGLDDDLFDSPIPKSKNDEGNNEDLNPYAEMDFDKENPNPEEDVSIDNLGTTVKRTKVTGHGTCTTATCKSFMIVGYAFVGTMLYVAYKIAQRKDLSGGLESFEYDDEEVVAFDEETIPTMRRHSQRIIS